MDFNKYSNNLLICSSDSLGVKTMNALRRGLLNCCPCYAFSDSLTEEQVELLRKANIDIKPNKKYFPVLNTNAGDLQFINHRFSRLAINSELPDSDYENLVFLLNSDPLQPFVNESNKAVAITAHDLIPYKYTEEDGVVNFTRLELDIARYFPYDTDLVTLLPGNSIMVALFPIFDVGLNNSRWYPVCVRYRFVPRVEVKREDSNLDEPDKVLVKEHEPLERYRKNQKIMVELGIEYNGRLSPKSALKRTLIYLRDQLLIFDREYNSGGGNFIKKENHPSRPHEQILTINDIPPNPETPNETVGFLGNHNLVELITEQLVNFLFELYQKEDDGETREKLITHTLCACRKPHPADDLMIINYRLPLEINEFKELLELEDSNITIDGTTSEVEIQDRLFSHIITNIIDTLNTITNSPDLNE